jgi:UDPglucose 6-dehydrogenase
VGVDVAHLPVVRREDVKIGVIGLGKLGLPLALTYASQNEVVRVYDTNERACDAVRNRKSHIDEPYVQEMLRQTKLHLVDVSELAEHSDVIFVVVPTPTRKTSNAFSNVYIREVLSSLPDTSGGGGSGKVVAIVSTVSPGSFTGVGSLVELAEARGYKLAYTPTLIALGTVVHDLIYPDVQIVGVDQSDEVTTRVVVNTLGTITKSPIAVTDFESAALAKLASNVFVTMKIGFANVLAHACDELGGDVDDVTRILGLNRRIGKKSLTAGAGYGGPCFPRDAAAFAVVCADTSIGLVGSTVQTVNARHLNYVVRRVRELVTTDEAKFVVLGRAYKEGSSYDIESFGQDLASRLAHYFDEAETHEADVVVVAQPLREMNLTHLVKHGAIVYDLWGTHAYLTQREDITYTALGRRSA